MVPSQMNAIVDGLDADIPDPSSPMPNLPPPPPQEREDSIDSSTLLVGPDTPVDENAPTCMPGDGASSLSTVV